MHYSVGFSLAALFAAVVNAAPQGVTAAVSPSSPAPSGCSGSYPGTFEITVEAISSSKAKRQTGGNLELTLNNGILLDQSGRTGYIAANYQFQFDKPPQAGAIYTAGFSVCGNGSLALGGSAIWYSCVSGGFSNLYNTDWAPQCKPIYIVTTGSSGGSSGSSGSGGASEAPEGQPQATSTITEAPEGQPEATSVSQRTDGQPIATAPAVSEASEGQPRVTSTAPAVSEASEGQPRVTSTAPAVSEASEGQPRVTSTAPAVSEASEGQPRVTSTAPAVSEASEGQPRVTSTAPAVSEASEGQPRVTSTAPPVSEASEGQPRATGNATVSASPSPARFTGLAVPLRAADAMFALAAAAAFALF